MQIPRYFRPILVAALGGISLTASTTIALGENPSATRMRLGVLLAVGDLMSCEDPSRAHTHDLVTGMLREIAAAEKQGLPVAVLMLGDLAYDHGSEDDFKCFHDEVTERLAEKLTHPLSTIMPVPGNHDMKASSGKWFYAEFKQNPWIGEGSPGFEKGYFTGAFPRGAAGAWRLFAINTQIGMEVGSAQYDWLKSALPGVKERCILGFWHKPVFSSGYHGHDENRDYEDAKPRRQDEMVAIFELLYSAHSSLVLNGHDHNFEYLEPHNPIGQSVNDGVAAFIVGTGGKRLYPEYKQKLDIMVYFDATEFGFLKIDLYADGYDWQFLKAGEQAETRYSGSNTCATRWRP